MTNVLIIRKEDPSLGAMNMAVTPQGGFSPQLNISSDKNIPLRAYFGARHDPKLGYTEKPKFETEKPQGIVEDGNTNFYYNNQSYGGGNEGREAALAQYGMDKDAHEALPEWNLTTGQRLAGLATTALPAAWTALSSFADDSQGDVFSSLGRAGMGAMATRNVLAPLERQAVGWAQNRYRPQPATPQPATSQSTLDEFIEPEKNTYNKVKPDNQQIASPNPEDSATVPLVQQAQQQAQQSMVDSVGTALGNTDAQQAVMATSKETGKNTQQVDMYGNPIKKAWRYY